MDIRIWISPSLCGCEIEINAMWAVEAITDEQGRKVSYQHPVPFTVQGLEIKNVCADHQSILSQPIDETPFQDFNTDGTLRPQQRGYLKLPIAEPTDAEKLYVGIYSIRGQKFIPDTCECEIYEIVENGVIRAEKHPTQTKKCECHEDDDDQHTEVYKENIEKSKAINAVMEAETKLKAEDIRFSFDEDRNLTLIINNTEVQDITILQDAVDDELGINKVRIM